MKESDIPPIRGNPRLGRETERDASVAYGGAQLRGRKSTGKKKKYPRRRKQWSFTIRNEDSLRRLAEKLGISAAAVVNLGIAQLAKEYL